MRAPRAVGALLGLLAIAQVGVATARAGDGGPSPPATTSTPVSTRAAAAPSTSSSPTPATLPGEPDPANGYVAIGRSDEPGPGGLGLDVDIALPQPAAPPACGRLDRRETGLQGDVPLADQLSGRAAQGYNCGLAVVGYEPLGGRAQNGNMTWAGHCAYIAGDGIAVVDVSDPAAPRHVTTLHAPGSESALEAIHAVDAPDRSLLVAGRYGLFFDTQGDPTPPLDIYDVSDCTRPRLLTTLEVPTGIHNVTLSADGRTLWTTLPTQAFDLTDPTRPRYLGSFDDALTAIGVDHIYKAHEVWPSPDGRLVYFGGQIIGEETTYIVDVEGWPDRAPRIVSRIPGPAHSIRPATIDGRPYVLRSDESVTPFTAFSCLPSVATPFGGVAQPVLTDVGDPAAPRDTGTLGLQINDIRHCPEQLVSGVNASSHYNSVDDPDDTTFAMVSMWNAGLRIFDVRDPSSPTEVAYFNPGAFAPPLLDDAPSVFDVPLNVAEVRGLDQAWAYSRYVPETGHLWLSTRLGGFWVLELEPQVRAALGLPPRPAANPEGGPPRPVAGASISRPSLLDVAPALYCTLGRF